MIVRDTESYIVYSSTDSQLNRRKINIANTNLNEGRCVETHVERSIRDRHGWTISELPRCHMTRELCVKQGKQGGVVSAVVTLAFHLCSYCCNRYNLDVAKEVPSIMVVFSALRRRCICGNFCGIVLQAGTLHTPADYLLYSQSNAESRTFGFYKVH